jgi:nucleotide-binding universal stress UspA family protein
MVPIDLSDRNERALRMAQALVRQSGARVTLFHVIEGVPGILAGELEGFYRRLVESSERRLRRRRGASALGIRVGTECASARRPPRSCERPAASEWTW